MDLMRREALQPVAPISTYSFSQVESAFRSLQGGANIGKTVVVPKIQDYVPVRIPLEPSLRSDGWYVIAGGLG